MEAPSGSGAAAGRAVAGGRHHAARTSDSSMTPQPDVIVAVRLDPAAEEINTASATMRLRGSSPASRRPRRAPTWSACCRSGSTRGQSPPGIDARRDCELANHSGRSSVEGRPGRRRGEHVVGAHGCDRRRAADRVRQHRESDARAGGRAAAGVRRARRARRGAGANRERVARRELGSGRSRQRARLGARIRWASRFSWRSARATCRAFRRSPSIRPCSRSPWRSRSRRRSCSARSRHSSTHCTSRRPRSAPRAARARAASGARRAARWSSCRWRSRSCWS